MDQCKRHKCGEYNMLRCVMSVGHEGECNFAVDREPEAPTDAGGQTMISEIRKLRAENEALRKDAERYRWLRRTWLDESQERDKEILMLMTCGSGDRFWHLDGAIDAAIAEEKK